MAGRRRTQTPEISVRASCRMPPLLRRQRVDRDSKWCRGTRIELVQQAEPAMLPLHQPNTSGLSYVRDNPLTRMVFICTADHKLLGKDYRACTCICIFRHCNTFILSPYSGASFIKRPHKQNKKGVNILTQPKSKHGGQFSATENIFSEEEQFFAVAYIACSRFLYRLWLPYLRLKAIFRKRGISP